MRVTLCATHCQAQPRGGCGIHPIDHCVKPEFQGINPSLLIDHRVAMKTGGHALSLRSICDHITGNLLDGKLIKRHIGIYRINHPVTPRPDGPRAIFLITIGISVTCQIQP